MLMWDVKVDLEMVGPQIWWTTTDGRIWEKMKVVDHFWKKKVVHGRFENFCIAHD